VALFFKGFVDKAVILKQHLDQN